MTKTRPFKLVSYQFSKKINFTAFSTFFVYNFKKGYVGTSENHKQFELIYVQEGSITTSEDDKTYTLTNGQAFLHKPYSFHHDEAKENSKVYITSFCCSSNDIKNLFDNVITLNNDDIYLINEIFTYVKKYIKIDKDNQMWFTGNTLLKDDLAPYGIIQIIKNKLELLFISFMSKNNMKNSENKRNFSSLTEKIIMELERKKYEGFNLDEIASKLHYSKNHLCRHFKENTNSTINEYFMTLKIAEAKKLLINEDSSILEISETLGFNTVQYFILCFKKIVGVTPTIFRKKSSTYSYY